MTSKEYIVKELNLLLEKIQSIRVRYEFDQLSSMHIIEIIPDDVYRKDKLYLEWEDNLFSRFIKDFPAENICFISDKSYIEVKNPVFVKEGATFASFSFKEDSRFSLQKTEIIPKFHEMPFSWISLAPDRCEHTSYSFSRQTITQYPVEIGNDNYLKAA